MRKRDRETELVIALGTERNNSNMKIIKDSINRTMSIPQGTIKVEPQEEEDMYFLYQILTKGDEVECLTVRNVSRKVL